MNDKKTTGDLLYENPLVVKVLFRIVPQRFKGDILAFKMRVGC